MSGTSYSNLCPVCQSDMDCNSDHKPFDNVGGSCIYCGFAYWTKAEQMSLIEINDLRKEHNENAEPKTPLKPMTTKEWARWAKEIKKL